MTDTLPGRRFGRLRWLTIVGLPLVTTVLAYLAFTPRFQSNDDVCMMMIAAGAGFSSEPSPFLVFMNPLVGQLLSSLYRLWPDGAWYALFLIAVRVFAGMAFVAAVLGRQPSSVLRVLLLFAYFLSVDLIGHVCPQFSVTAALAAQGALLLWLCRDRECPWTPGRLFAFLGLFGCGIVIRLDHALLIVTLALPLVVADALKVFRGHEASAADGFSARLRHWVWQTGFPLFASAGLAITLVGYHLWFYHTSPGWRDFYAYNHLRSQITDCNRDATPATDEVFRQVGWSPNDLAMLKSFFFADPEVYSAAKLRAFLHACPSRPLDVFSLTRQVRSLSRDRLLRLLLAMALFPALFLPLSRGLGYAAVCGMAVFVWLVIGGVAHHYCPWHFLQAMLAFIAAVAVAQVTSRPYHSLRGVACVAGTSLLLISFVLGIYQLRLRSVESVNFSRKLWKEIQLLDPQPDSLYVAWGSDFPFEQILPFDSLRHLRRFNMYGLGWAANTPLMDQQLQKFSIPDLVSGLYQHRKVFLICGGENFSLLQTYLDQHRGVSVASRLLFLQPDGSFAVCQVARNQKPSPWLLTGRSYLAKIMRRGFLESFCKWLVGTPRRIARAQD